MTLCDLCQQPIPYDPLTGVGPGYWYVRTQGGWKRICRPCWQSILDSDARLCVS